MGFKTPLYLFNLSASVYQSLIPFECATPSWGSCNSSLEFRAVPIALRFPEAFVIAQYIVVVDSVAASIKDFICYSAR